MSKKLFECVCAVVIVCGMLALVRVYTTPDAPTQHAQRLRYYDCFDTSRDTITVVPQRPRRVPM